MKHVYTAMTISSKRYLLPFEEVAKYLGFDKSVADSRGFSGIKPKYLTTVPPWRDGIRKRYHFEETAIASYGRYTLAIPLQQDKPFSNRNLGLIRCLIKINFR
jgi:hypothetical protein